MATTLRALSCLAALCLAAGAPPEYATDASGRNAEITSLVPSESQDSRLTGDNVIPLLSQFTGQDPLEESTDVAEAGGGRQKRTFGCKKCGYGGGYKRGHGGGYRTYVVPVRVVVRPQPVYYYRRPQYNYCDPCARRRYGGGGGGGGGGAYATSFSYSSATAYSGKRK